MGVEAIVKLELESLQTKHYPTELSLIYDVIELSDNSSPRPDASGSNYSTSTILLWVLLPFAVAGLALYLSIRFFIKKYRGMVPDDLVEEDIIDESGEVVNQDGHQELQRQWHLPVRQLINSSLYHDGVATNNSLIWYG